MFTQYEEKRTEIEKALARCEDAKAAYDCLALWLERLRGEVRLELEPRERARADELFRVATRAAACMQAVTAGDVRVKTRPGGTATRREKLLAKVPYAAMGLSLLLCVWLILQGQTIPAVLCVALAGASWLATLKGGERAFEPEYQLTTRPDAAELMRQLDRLMEELERALKPEEESAGAAASEPLRLTEGLLGSVQMLMEAAYTRDGDYALKAMPQIREALYAQGVEALDFTTERSAYFELFPSERGGQTIRPAFLRDGKLILRGQATEDIR